MTKTAVGPGGFIYDPELLSAAAVEKIADRALLALVISCTPGFQTPGGIPKTETGKAREIDRAELQILLRLMVNDFHLRVAGGGYTETALQHRLEELAVERGLLAHRPHEYPVFRPRRDHVNWSLTDVMTEERRDREHPRRSSPVPVRRRTS
jgi:hypothetical protein